MKAKILLLLCASLVMLPVTALAAEIKLTSSTHYLWYEDFLTDSTEKDVAEYLRLAVSNIDKSGKMSIAGYGRISKQISSDEDMKGRLFYLYLDYRDAIKDVLDMRIGRQYVFSSALSDTINGVDLHFKKMGPVGVRLFGGTTVSFENKTDTTYSGDGLFGASIYYDKMKNTHIELSYGKKFVEGDGARELLGFNFSTSPVRQLNLYAKLKHDLIAQASAEALLGVRIIPTAALTLTGEHYESYPLFDATSVYSVFAVEKYKQDSLKAEYRVSDIARFSAAYAREYFTATDKANLYQAGVNVRPVKNLSVSVDYEKRIGYASRLSGFRANGEYRLGKTSVSAGLDYDDFGREDYRTSYAKKFWAGVKHDLTKKISATARFENNNDYMYDNSYQGFAALNINF